MNATINVEQKFVIVAEITKGLPVVIADGR
jgi:hypothetical protein